MRCRRPGLSPPPSPPFPPPPPTAVFFGKMNLSAKMRSNLLISLCVICILCASAGAAEIEMVRFTIDATANVNPITPQPSGKIPVTDSFGDTLLAFSVSTLAFSP
jgi:hypothetical protein